MNEIKLTNEVVWPPQKLEKVKENKKNKPKAEKQEILVSTEIEKELSNLLKADDLVKFLKFIDEINWYNILLVNSLLKIIHSSSTFKSQNFEVISPEDKNDRRILHEIIRNLSTQFDSETV